MLLIASPPFLQQGFEFLVVSTEILLEGHSSPRSQITKFFVESGATLHCRHLIQSSRDLGVIQDSSEFDLCLLVKKRHPMGAKFPKPDF